MVSVEDNFPWPKNIVILGSTGSIGQSTLDVVRQFPDKFKIIGLAAGKNLSLLLHQIKEFNPPFVCVRSAQDAKELSWMLSGEKLRPKILWDDEGYCEIASLPEAHMVVSALVGAAGLIPTVHAIRAGKDIALANKETLVIAGDLVVAEVDRTGVRLLPVDSEHNAIFQAMEGHRRVHVKRILLTASGGPFFKLTREELAKVTPEQALKHPNWSMGKKITVDSATLMNKGLELIEAHWLFRLPPEMITIYIHPESIIHSMVEYVDGSIIAHLAVPDMRIPIAYALSYPDRLPLRVPVLNLFEIGHLTFFPPDEEKFPCLRLAKEVCRKKGTLPIVLNAANEIAVDAFLAGRIGFLDIPEVIEYIMSEHERMNGNISASDFDTVLQVDSWARRETSEYIVRRQSNMS
ncbi:MAG: 1-deoxy-D-xylulose-5-phosphate reductoisomerase [Syntrophobacterales bacterium]|nr:1-deoxy-D-xylulose-5-phosphate reductoisomerase [Syntrophobacterales bacterium]